jgi:hypothetical protein
MDTELGIRVASDNVTIERSDFRDNFYYQALISVVWGGKAKISNSTFQASMFTAIDTYWGGKAIVTDCEIYGSGTADDGYYSRRGELEIVNSEIYGSEYGLDITDGKLFAKGTKIHNCSKAIYLYRSSAELVGNELNNNGIAIQAHQDCTIDMRDGNHIYNIRDTYNSIFMQYNVQFNSTKDKFEAFRNRLIVAEASQVNLREAKLLGDGAPLVTVRDGSKGAGARVLPPMAYRYGAAPAPRSRGARSIISTRSESCILIRTSRRRIRPRIHVITLLH